MQIGKRIRRLERARLAADRPTTRKQFGVNIASDKGMGMNTDARYEVPLSRSDPVNIYNFVRAHREDPAIVVGLPCDL